MRKTKSLAILFVCAMLPGMITGCEVHVESETPLSEDVGEDVSTETDTNPDQDDSGTPDDDVADGGDAEDDGGLNPPPTVERGEYLVNHVAACVDCHTPRTSEGHFDSSRHLSGVDCFVDFTPDPDDGVGCVSSLNLTNHQTGIGRYTDDQVFELLRTGTTMHEDEKKILIPIMPYWTFANMTDSDLRSIIAYLRDIPEINNVPAPNEPLPAPFAIIEQRTEPALPVTLDDFPESELQPGDEGYEQAQHGKYLVAAAGCMDCHTPQTIPDQEDPDSDWVPADRSMILQGGREFPIGPDMITSTNLTPHDTGIWDYGPEEIRIALKVGKDSEDRQMCPPMPGGPESPYGGMTDEDALAIGWYLTTIPPVDNANPECNR